jgi:hypothetical protein
MIRTFVAVSALAFSGTLLAATATVTSASGGVMVNQGDAFRPAQVGQVLNTGDRVMVPAGASSSLSFDDGCVLQVQPDTLITIPANSTCAGGDAMAQRVTPSGSTAVGTRTAYAGEDSWFGWGYLGTVVAVTAIMIANDDNDDDDDEEVPVSP